MDTVVFLSMFYSRVKYPKRECVPSGERIVPEYGWKVDEKTSEKYIGVIGEKNLYDPIQAALPGTYLHDVLDRFDAGAVSLDDYKEYIDASKQVAAYTDVTPLPSTLAEVQQVLIDADNTFNSLPVDLRADFGHSKERFLASMADGSAASVFNLYAERKGLRRSVKEDTKEDKKDES